MTSCSTTTPVTERRSHLSADYVTVQFTADVNLDAQLVDIAIVRAFTTPAVADWQTADWIGVDVVNADGDHVRSAQIFPGPTTADTWHVYGRVTDNPEVPVMFAGTLITD